MLFSDNDLIFLALVSDLVAIALHNASLFFASTHDALTKIYGLMWRSTDAGRCGRFCNRSAGALVRR